ncbi:DUF742 domain-containing protein [Streptomyces sp. NPDC051572]|uniref:DUF742 domain-containing protein n=1 Tax=Streptomyces sp. NPDC051572 TaxID=3155802 RepID=UPI00344B3E70
MPYVRPFMLTGGRTDHSQYGFALITLILAQSADESALKHLNAEAEQIFRLCQGRAMAIAEIAANLYLPVGVVKVLCGDLLEASLVMVQAPLQDEEHPISIELIERVIDGIRHL